MIAGLVDTTVIIHLFRGLDSAKIWFETQSNSLAVTSITWLEVMEGATSKVNQAYSRETLERFDTVYLTVSDQAWAMQQNRSVSIQSSYRHE